MKLLVSLAAQSRTCPGGGGLIGSTPPPSLPPKTPQTIDLYSYIKRKKEKKPRKRKSFDVKHGPFYRAVNLHLPWAMHIPFTLKNNLIFLYNIFFLLFYSGAIRTRAVLDRESQANYWLTVVAQDHGIVSLSTSIDVRFCLHFRF